MTVSKISPLSNVYDRMYADMNSHNSTIVGLEVEIPRGQGQPVKTCIYTLNGIFSGEKKQLIDDSNSSKMIATLKLRVRDLKLSKFDTQNPMFGVLTAPTENLKAFVITVRINNYKYIITEETKSGFSFSDVIKLKLERKQ